MDIQISNDKHISRLIDWENHILDEIEPKTEHQDKEGDQ